jgi:hypothetical protein
VAVSMEIEKPQTSFLSSTDLYSLPIIADGVDQRRRSERWFALIELWLD